MSGGVGVLSEECVSGGVEWVLSEECVSGGVGSE